MTDRVGALYKPSFQKSLDFLCNACNTLKTKLDRRKNTMGKFVKFSNSTVRDDSKSSRLISNRFGYAVKEAFSKGSVFAKLGHCSSICANREGICQTVLKEYFPM